MASSLVATGIQFPDSSIQTTATLNPAFKNRIINGAMVIDQRNAGASVTPANGAYTLDRFCYLSSQASKFTIEQTITGVAAPVGFTDYLGATVASPVTIGASDYFTLAQIVEGFNFADMMWGTANAQTVTLSFWVRSSLTGTFGGTLRNGAANRSYPYTYTVSSANTWEQKSITIAGDTTGTWIGATNGVGVQVLFSLGTGSTFSGTAGAWAGSNLISATGATSVVGTNGATFYITGVQLEKGSTATSFDYRPYGTELALCQRYFYRMAGSGTAYTPAFAVGYMRSTTIFNAYIPLPVTMRAAPTLNASNFSGAFYVSTTGDASSNTVSLGTSSVNNVQVAVTTAAVTAGSGGILFAGVAGTAALELSSEL